MFVVAVTFQIEMGYMDAFLPLMKQNAETSLEQEAGCHQFDVCQSSSTENVVFLYEVYTDKTAFELHLASNHFREFDKEVAHMIENKLVQTYTRIVP